MCKKLYIFILCLFIVVTDIALGKDGNQTKTHKFHTKYKNTRERIKRSMQDDREPFWPNRGKKPSEAINYIPEHLVEDVVGVVHKEPPFWGARGRRDGSSENYNDLDYSEEYEIYNQNLNKCMDCLNDAQKVSQKYLKNVREDLSPFWGNRGKKYSNDYPYPLERFWGSRGRRYDYDLFWRNLAKKDEEPFWGNRGKKEDEPFWGNRGKKEDEPFWGNRGRRDDIDPFWGNRGKKQDYEPFWGNRGRREDDQFWANRGRRKMDNFFNIEDLQTERLKQPIQNIFDVSQDDNVHGSLREIPNVDLWLKNGRSNKLMNLSKGKRNAGGENYVPNQQSHEPGTMYDNKIYADEPHYILVDRSSRSSGEDDPFFISRGKKYFLKYNLAKTARDRRGAIEDIVKSVRNEPYYIARGKKNKIINENQTVAYLKAKEMICSTIGVIKRKNDNGKVKRESDDNERNRRATLKKLAASLQMDPYFVSRGKKSVTNNKESLLDFINDVADKCN